MVAVNCVQLIQRFSRPLPRFNQTPRLRCRQSAVITAQLSSVTPRIDAIVTDVDGTLLNHQQQLTDRTCAALNAAAAAGVKVVLATGKARGPWVNDVHPRLNLAGPCVYLQGLLIYDAHGNVLHSQTLPIDIITTVLEYAQRKALTVTVYSNDGILCAHTDKHTDRLVWYREPTPEPVGDLLPQAGKEPFHKMILMAEDEVIQSIRPEVEQLLEGKATLTTALSGMLEVLPQGASKAQGVSLILPTLSVTWDNVLAAGDGENDIEMLQAAGWAVAMGNAGEMVKQAADHITDTNDEDGLAAAIEQFVLAPRTILT